MKKELMKQIKNLLKGADYRKDALVLVENGKETNNRYELAYMYEPDTKTIEDWVGGILFINKFSGKNATISFNLKKDCVKPFI